MQVVNTGSRWLFDFVEDFENNVLLLPEHQKIRGDVWSDQKKKDWWEKIELTYELGKQAANRASRPWLSGMITTYQLEDDPNNVTYLNDGANRTIHSILGYISHCKGLGKDYQDVLRHVQITEQNMLYSSKEEAIQDYIDLNSKGTVATPYEILSCRFVSGLNQYSLIWASLFERIHSVVDDNLKVLGYKGKGKREVSHKMRRDNLALFVRYIAEDTTKWSPCVTNQLIDFCNKRHTAVEDRLLAQCKEKGSQKISELLDKFDVQLTKWIAFYRQVQQEYGKQNTMLTLTAIRWWLTYAVYHSNNAFDTETLLIFTRKLFELNGGKTTMIYRSESGENTNVNAQLQHLGNINTVYKALGVSVEEIERKPDLRKKNGRVMPGYVNSHIKSFSHNGNGETLPENAIENALRSAQNMTAEEEERIRNLNAPSGGQFRDFPSPS